MRTTEKIKEAKLDDLLRLLESRLDSSKAKIVAVPRDDFPDGVKRTMKTVNELRGGYHGNGKKLVYHDRWYTSLAPGLIDLTAEEVRESGTENFAVFFVAYQFDGYVLLEIQYTELWEELVTSILSDLPHLDEAQSSVALPEIKDPTDKRIWDYIQKDPSITDKELVAKIGIGRTAINVRRNRLKAGGYEVRAPKQKKVSRQNK